MPYKSDAQRRYFNANRSKLEAQGVDVDEWNESSRGKKLPPKAKKKNSEKSAVALLAKLAADPISATLQDLLSNCLDLSLLLKHCHWNVRGTMFSPVHAFLDKVYALTVEISDDIAERMVSLDYPASGISSDVVNKSSMGDMATKFIGPETIINELTTKLTKLVEMFKSAIESTDSDPVTSNMIQDMTHKLEKSLWMLRSQKPNAATKEASNLKDFTNMFSNYSQPTDIKTLAKQAGWKTELLGNVGNTPLLSLLGALAGGGIGMAANRDGKKPYAPLGYAVLGSGLGASTSLTGRAIAPVAALMTDTRDTKDQAKADLSTWSNLLMPGKADYNTWKRLGYSMRNPDLVSERIKARRGDDDNKEESNDIKELAKAAAGRCWKGYEPVPGKEPYSEDSCRPAGGKKKKQEKKASRDITINGGYHKPSIFRGSLPFTLGGAALGGLAGGVYNRFRGEDEDRPAWKDILTGAGAGAGAGFASNLAGNAVVDNDIGLRLGTGPLFEKYLALLSAMPAAGLGGIAAADLTEEIHSPHEENKEKEKKAARLDDAGFVGQGIAKSVGQLGNLMSLGGPIMAGAASMKDPDKDRTEKVVELLSKVRPNKLKDVLVRRGSPNLWEDMVWKGEEEGEDLPWYKQIGGRILQNPRNGPIGKLYGYATNPIAYLLSNLNRSPHYNPASDTISNYWDNDAVTEHELGHAIDFNSFNDGKIPKSLLGRLGYGTLRDLYGLAYKIPFASLIHETAANRESEKALAEALSKKDFLKRTRERSEILPAGLGSYVGSNIGMAAQMGLPNLPLKNIGTLAGIMAGKVSGPAAYDRKAKVEEWEKAQERKKKNKQSEKNEKSEKEGFDDNPIQELAKLAAEANRPCSCNCGDTVSTCKCGADCKCRKEGGSCYAGEKKAGSKSGLWDNIHAKRKRGEKPAKPGDKDYPDSNSWQKTTKESAELFASVIEKAAGSPAWQKSEGKNSEGGLNAKGRASYNKSTGGNLKAPVTQKNPKGEAKGRKASFCARMGGMKKKLTGEETKNDPDSRINKALRKWNC